MCKRTTAIYLLQRTSIDERFPKRMGQGGNRLLEPHTPHPGNISAALQETATATCVHVNAGQSSHGLSTIFMLPQTITVCAHACTCSTHAALMSPITTKSNSIKHYFTGVSNSAIAPTVCHHGWCSRPPILGQTQKQDSCNLRTSSMKTGTAT